MITIRRAAALVTVQDRGWPAGRAIGLPRSGALDQEALELANLLVGNRPGAAVLEVALGGLVELEFEDATVFALAGGVAAVSLDGASVPTETTLAAGSGSVLRVGRAQAGRFAYLAVRGGADVPAVLGARATYLPTGLGGFQGRRLQPGDRVPTGGDVEGAPPPPGSQAPPLPASSGPLGLIPGPQLDLFPESARAAVEREAFTVSPRSDRMGARLAGPAIRPGVTARLPSEGTCVGAVQVPDDGQPIVILADGPTVGGYPKIGAVASVDLARLVQTPVGGAVRFAWMGVAEAQAALYDRRAALAARSAAVRRAGG